MKTAENRCCCHHCCSCCYYADYNDVYQ